MKYVSIVGTGFVADLYMHSLRAHADIAVRTAFDRDGARLAAFCRYWNVPPADSLDELLGGADSNEVVLNLTNPSSHFDVSIRCIEAGRHVYSEKPLALDFDQAKTLYDSARRHGVLLASAPCSVLGEACQTLWLAVRERIIGEPLLVYAELDDGYVSKAPYERWRSSTGAPWPYRDEFAVGCTVEHAGYYLAWLVAMFGPVRTVVAASAELDLTKPRGPTPAADYSTAVLFFEGGTVARLTCSILARHDHGISIVGERGTLEVSECWNNDARVHLRRRRQFRRRLVELPIRTRLRVRGTTHPKVGRRGAAAMNFALGPAEMLAAIAERRPCRLSAELALHLTEVTLAIHNSGRSAGAMAMSSLVPEMQPQAWAHGPLR